MASTESLSDDSTLSSDTGPEIPFNAGMCMFYVSVVCNYDLCTMIYAEHTSDEVAIFYRKVTISTTRRLPAQNISEGAGTLFLR